MFKKPNLQRPEATVLNYTKYTGEELKPHFRKGSMVAYQLPSLVNGQLIERKKPMAMCSSVKFTQQST